MNARDKDIIRTLSKVTRWGQACLAFAFDALDSSYDRLLQAMDLANKHELYLSDAVRCIRRDIKNKGSEQMKQTIKIRCPQCKDVVHTRRTLNDLTIERTHGMTWCCVKCAHTFNAIDHVVEDPKPEDLKQEKTGGRGMKTEDMEKVIGDCIENITTVLSAKAEDYAKDGDRLHNFRRAALVGETTMAKALLGMKLKHDVSILDIVDAHDTGRVQHNAAYLDEKFGDAINYLILLKAIIINGEVK